MTYTMVNLAFLLVALVVGVVAHVRRTSDQRRRAFVSQGIALVVLCILTAIFDSIIIGSGLVAYDESLTSGIRIGLAPIEDFAYTLAVVVIAPGLWDLMTPEDT